MKQIFNWTIGSFFRSIGRIVAYIVVGILIAFLLDKLGINLFMPKLSAATLNSYNTYERIMNQETGCGTSNRYSYTTYANNDISGDLYNIGSFNTQYSGKAAFLGFNFQYNLTAGKYYDIEVNFNTSDLSDALTTTNVFVDSGTSCQDTTGDRVALIGFSLSHSGTNYSNKATIRIMANAATTYWGFYFYKGPGQYVTGVNNWRINSITINEVDPSNTNVIIDNATNNTTNIINNNNENTQQIIDNQSQLLGKKCSNLFNKNAVINNTTFDSSGNSFTANGFFATSDYIEVSPSTQYSFDSYNGYRVVEYNSSKTFIQRLFDVRYFTTSSNTYYIKLSGNTSNLNNVMLVKGSTSQPYCEYGSYSSKLDETNSSINNLTDTLTDTNTDSDANDLSSYFNNLNISSHNTLANIVLLPVNFLSQLLDNTSDDDICTTYKNKQICLPSGNLVWGRNHSLINAFKLFFQLVVGGYLSYKCLTAIFHTAENALQPDKTTAEVMKL